MGQIDLSTFIREGTALDYNSVVKIFDANRTRRITELLLGQVQVTLAEIEKILPDGVASTEVTEAQLESLQAICADLSGYCENLRDMLTPYSGDRKPSPMEEIKAAVVSEYVLSQPIMLLAEKLNIFARSGKIGSASWFIGPVPENGLHARLFFDEAVTPFVQYARDITGLAPILGASVASFQLSLMSERQYLRFSEVCKSLVMDTTLPVAMREGFGIEITEEIAKDILSPQSTAMFVVYQDRKAVGYVVLYTTFEMLPESDRECIRQYQKQNGFSDKNTAYLYLVATDPSARSLFYCCDSSVYRTLMQSVECFCSINGVELLLFDVWEDNTRGIEKHKKQGWTLTGLEHLATRHDGEYRRLQGRYPLPNRTPASQNASLILDPYFLRASRVLGNPRDILALRAQDPEPALNIKSAEKIAVETLTQLRPELIRSGEVDILVSDAYLGGEICVLLTLRGQQLYAIRQALRDQDAWHCPERGVRIGSLRECISHIAPMLTY